MATLAAGASPNALPPGPRGLPLVGVGLAFRRDQLGFLTRLARRYGDAVTIHLGRRGRVFAFNAPRAVEALLVEQARNFTSRELNYPSMPFLGEGLLNLDGEVHRRQRAAVQPAFSRRRIEAQADTMVACTEELLAAWRPGQVIDASREMQRLTLRIAARALFGLELRREVEAFGQAFDRIAGYDEAGPFGLQRLQVNLPWTAYGRLLRAEKFLDSRIYGLIAARRRQGSGGGDVLSLLLSEAGLEDRQVRDHSLTFLAAGHETTSHALTYTLHLLGRHPAACAALQAELRRELGGSRPTVEDLPRLTYLDLALKEALRLYPPAWIQGRHAVRDFELLGYRLPADSYCLISQWVIHRRPEYWPEPDRFRPERWLPPEQGGQRLVPYAYFPFGGGPRTCIGMPFALQEAHLILAMLLQRFTPEPLPGQRLRLAPRVTLRPSGGTRLRLRPAAD